MERQIAPLRDEITRLEPENDALVLNSDGYDKLKDFSLTPTDRLVELLKKSVPVDMHQAMGPGLMSLLVKLESCYPQWNTMISLEESSV